MSEDASLAHIGWLDRDHPFESGATPDAFRDRLAYLSAHGLSARTRGIHTCELCDEGGAEPCYLVVSGERHLLGSAEIRIGGFAAPSLLLHYVVHHRYRPPSEFIETVLAYPHTLAPDAWSLTLRAHASAAAPPPAAEPPREVDLNRAVPGELVSSVQLSVFRPLPPERGFVAIATAHLWDAEIEAPPLRPYQKYLAGAVLQARSGRGAASTQEGAVRAALSVLFYQIGPDAHHDENKKEEV